MLTVYDIETCYQTQVVQDQYLQPLQQYLPFTVLKHYFSEFITSNCTVVATAPTVHCIETDRFLCKLYSFCKLQQPLPFTVLKRVRNVANFHKLRLQQYLPFTVLKRTGNIRFSTNFIRLQQCLSFTVLKLSKTHIVKYHDTIRCNSTYRLRY